jgi:hypothetical protein
MYLALLPVFALGCAGRFSHHLNAPIRTARQMPDARTLLQSCRTRYETLQSYADVGCVYITYGGAAPHTQRLPFQTAFTRQGGFRFEFTDRFMLFPPTHFAVWTQGSEVRSWWTIHPVVEHFHSLADAIAGATGISGGSAHTVPTLLLASQGTGWRITDVRSPELLGLQTLPDSTACYVIAGKNFCGDTIHLWLDRQNLVLRRVYSTSTLSGGVRVEDTTIYEPHLNPNLPSSVFVFVPPRQISFGGCFVIDVPHS